MWSSGTSPPSSFGPPVAGVGRWPCFPEPPVRARGDEYVDDVPDAAAASFRHPSPSWPRPHHLHSVLAVGRPAGAPSRPLRRAPVRWDVRDERVNASMDGSIDPLFFFLFLPARAAQQTVQSSPTQQVAAQLAQSAQPSANRPVLFFFPSKQWIAILRTAITFDS